MMYLLVELLCTSSACVVRPPRFHRHDDFRPQILLRKLGLRVYGSERWNSYKDWYLTHFIRTGTHFLNKRYCYSDKIK